MYNGVRESAAAVRGTILATEWRERHRHPALAGVRQELLVLPIGECTVTAGDC